MSFGCIEVSERELHYELLSTTLENHSHLRGLGAAVAARLLGQGAVRRSGPTGAGQDPPDAGAAGEDFRHDRSSAVVAVSRNPIPFLANRVAPGSEPGDRRPPLRSRADDRRAGSNPCDARWVSICEPITASIGSLLSPLRRRSKGAEWPSSTRLGRGDGVSGDAPGPPPARLTLSIV